MPLTCGHCKLTAPVPSPEDTAFLKGPLAEYEKLQTTFLQLDKVFLYLLHCTHL